MKFEEISYEGVLESHFKIFIYLAGKYVSSIIGYDFDDLVQIQKIACLKALEKFDKNRNLGSFFYSVAENKLKSLYRHELRQKRRPRQLFYLEAANFEDAGLMICEEKNVEIDFYLTEVRDRADVIAPEVLSDFEYKLYTNIVKLGKSNLEVAIILGKTEKQIANGITRMRRKMSEKRESILNDL